MPTSATQHIDDLPSGESKLGKERRTARKCPQMCDDTEVRHRTYAPVLAHTTIAT
jgi:hypothetical protein